MRSENITEQIKCLVSLLVQKYYSEIEYNDFEKRVSATGLEEVIKDYGGEVTMPTDTAFDQLDICEIKGEEKEVAVDFKIWIDGQQSDLTLSCSIMEDKGGFRYTIDDLRVQ